MVPGHCPPDDSMTKSSSFQLSHQNLPLDLRLGLILRLRLPIFNVPTFWKWFLGLSTTGNCRLEAVFSFLLCIVCYHL